MTELCEISELLITLEENGKTNTKEYQKYLKEWEDLYEKEEYKNWCNSQPI